MNLRALCNQMLSIPVAIKQLGAEGEYHLDTQ